MPRHIQYESPDYGVFLIQQHEPKWVIGWDPEFCELNTMNEDLDIDSLLESCFSNSMNLTSEDFKDLPKNGEFASEEEAKNYLESKFGPIN